MPQMPKPLPKCVYAQPSPPEGLDMPELPEERTARMLGMRRSGYMQLREVGVAW